MARDTATEKLSLDFTVTVPKNFQVGKGPIYGEIQDVFDLIEQVLNGLVKDMEFSTSEILPNNSLDKNDQEFKLKLSVTTQTSPEISTLTDLASFIKGKILDGVFGSLVTYPLIQSKV